MTKEKIDHDEIIKMIYEVNARFEVISYILRNEYKVLKHLASCSIHMTMFLRDLQDFNLNINSLPLIIEKDFLDQCGCDINSEEKH
jgi:hypothetical protein